MIAPADIDALEALANELGFTMYRRANVRHIGLDVERVPSSREFDCRLGHCKIAIEFEGTPRECAAFLIGWRDARSERNHL